MPSALESATDPVRTADLHYRVALFAREVAGRCGVPGATSPTAWEEQAVAEYERLALVSDPDPAACHRLGIIYARRGYRRQAREMLMRAAPRDEEAAEVYWALMLVYSDETLKARDIPALRRQLLRQPAWLAEWTLGDLARRVSLEAVGRVHDQQATDHLWRFGLAVSAALLVGGALVVFSLAAGGLLVLRALFRRGRVDRPWPSALPPTGWLDVLDVAGLTMLGNALGQVGRDALASRVAPETTADLALRAAHVVLAVGPPLVLVVRRVESGRLPVGRALGLVSHGAARHVFQALVGLGLALVCGVFLQEVLIASMRLALPGLMPAGALGAQARPVAPWQDALLGFLFIAIIAPCAEELIFRGFVFRALLDHLRPFGAVIISSVLFAAAHLTWDPAALMSLFLLGLVCAQVYSSTRSIIPSLLVHTGYNAAILLAAHLVRL
jgi:membrane protease YdiL (CAAX protease family)